MPAHHHYILRRVILVGLICGWHFLWWIWMRPAASEPPRSGSASRVRYLPLVHSEGGARQIWSPIFMPAEGSFTASGREGVEVLPPLGSSQDLAVLLPRMAFPLRREHPDPGSGLLRAANRHLENLPPRRAKPAAVLPARPRRGWQALHGPEAGLITGIDLAGLPAAGTNQPAWELVVDVEWDAAGNAERVLIEQVSGQPEIDQAAVRQLYRSRIPAETQPRHARLVLRVEAER